MGTRHTTHITRPILRLGSLREPEGSSEHRTAGQAPYDIKYKNKNHLQTNLHE